MRSLPIVQTIASRSAYRGAVLDASSFAMAATALCEADDGLARIVERHGLPEFWAREPGLETLVLLILEQQVSLASARAAYGRLESRLGGLTTAGILRSTDEELRGDGFSRQKARYVRALSAAIEDGSLDLLALATLDDDGVRNALVALPGIGPWTASYIAMRGLSDPDVFLGGDLILRRALDTLSGEGSDRSRSDTAACPPIGERAANDRAVAWRPWRSYAVMHLWAHQTAIRVNRTAPSHVDRRPVPAAARRIA